jgi:iron complex transport system permease protein
MLDEQPVASRGSATRAAAGPRPRPAWLLPATVAALTTAMAISVVIAVGIGPVSIGFDRVWGILGHAALPDLVGPHGTLNERIIALDLRAPRGLLGAVVGAGLGVAGAVLQTVLRNPLADPYVVGLSSGAALGAVVVLLGAAGLGATGIGIAAQLGTSGGAFAGALAAFGLVWAFGRHRGQISPLRMLLGGVAVAALLSAATNWVVLTADSQEVRSALYWTLGSLTGSAWGDLALPSLAVIVLTAWFTLQGRTLNALALGDEHAATLGVAVHRARASLTAVAALLVAVTVAVAGSILFFALVVPHLVRLVLGADHRVLLPVSALLGAVLLVWFDVAARLLIAPAEMPIGVVTSLLGAPAFLMLMLRSNRGAR